MHTLTVQSKWLIDQWAWCAEIRAAYIVACRHLKTHLPETKGRRMYTVNCFTSQYVITPPPHRARNIQSKKPQTKTKKSRVFGYVSQIVLCSIVLSLLITGCERWFNYIGWLVRAVDTLKYSSSHFPYTGHCVWRMQLLRWLTKRAFQTTKPQPTEHVKVNSFV
jgi:hypothetical protein